MMPSSMESVECCNDVDQGLWLWGVENLCARRRFCFYDDREDERIGFKEITRCMMPRE